MLVVESVTEEVPEPESATLCGLLVALSVTFKVAESEPATTGVNVTLTVQLAPAATLDPQSLFCVKLPGLLPPMAMLLMFSATLWLLLRITLCAGLLVPVACAPNAMLVGETVALPQAGTLKLEILVCQFVAEPV